MFPGFSWPMAVMGVVVFFMLGHQAWSAWTRHQRRRRMVTEKKLPVKRRKTPWDASKISTAVLGVGFAVALIVMEDRYGTGKSILILLPFFLVAVVGSVLFVNWMRDGVVRQGEMLARRKDVPGAIEALRKGIAVRETPERLHLLAILLLSTGEADEALRLAGRAVTLAPGRAKYAATMGVAVAKAGDLPQALQMFESIRRQEPQEVLFACQYCELLAEAGRMEEAREQLRQAEELIRVVANEQQESESFWMAGTLLASCRKRVGEETGRAFSVEGVRGAPSA